MDQIERIEYMEKILDDSNEAINKLFDALENYSALHDKYRELIDYYSGNAWMKDFESDEAGNLPQDLKRGVLSEDAVYDLITKNHLLTVKMLEIVTNNVKKG